MIEGEAVLACGERVIQLYEGGGDEEAVIQLVDEYCNLFALWERSQGVGTAESGEPRNADLLGRIAECNERVISILASYEKEASADLAGALKWSKAVRAYIDVLPQRVSVGRPKKG